MSWQSQGFRPWFLQRLTAFIIGIGIISMSWWVLNNPVMTFSQWREFFSQPLVNLCTVLFVYSVLYHAWVGMRDVIIDYVHHQFLRITLFTVFSLLFFALGIWISMIMATVISL